MIRCVAHTTRRSSDRPAEAVAAGVVVDDYAADHGSRGTLRAEHSGRNHPPCSSKGRGASREPSPEGSLVPPKANVREAKRPTPRCRRQRGSTDPVTTSTKQLNRPHDNVDQAARDDVDVGHQLPKSLIGIATRYSLKRWAVLGRFPEDVRVPVDKNLSEPALRRVAAGRKSFLFGDAGRRSRVSPRWQRRVRSADTDAAVVGEPGGAHMACGPVGAVFSSTHAVVGAAWGTR